MSIPYAIYTCPYYSIEADSTAECGPVSICPGNTITVNGCGSCTGQQWLTLSNATGQEVAGYYGGCGSGSSCSKFTYTVPPDADCMDYEIGEYCPGIYPCTGTVTYDQFPSATPLVQFFDDSVCSGATSFSGLSSPGSCIEINGTGEWAQVTCDGVTSSSSWSVTVYPTDQCVGVYDEKSFGEDSSSCVPFADHHLTGLSLKVDCSGNITAPDNNNNNNSNALSTTELGAVIGGSILAFLLILVAVLVCMGVIKCGRKPMAAAEAEPSV